MKYPNFNLLARLVLIVAIALNIESSSAANQQAGYYGNGNQVKVNVPVKRDPFTTSDKMYGEVGVQSAQKANAQQGFVPGYGVQNVPKMRLKGYITKYKNKSTALLDIEGAGVYMVSRGDEIGLHSVGQNTVLKIIDVGPNGVKVQSGQVNQVIVVR